MSVVISAKSSRQGRRSNRAARPASSTSVTVSQPPNTVVVSQPRRSRRRRQRNQSSTSLPPLLLDYVHTLNDPFSYGPVRMGFGTMVPTETHTCYIRFPCSTGSDGTLAVALFPTVGNTSHPIFYNPSGAATWSSLQFPNTTAMAAILQSARVVSGGIRIIPSANYSAPQGVVFAGALSSITPNQLLAKTCTQLLALPQLKLGHGVQGATAVTHPIDNEAFEFKALTIQGDADTYFKGSIPLIVLSGFAAGSQVFVEVALNLEGLHTFSAATDLEETGQSNDTPGGSLADLAYNSMESIYRNIKGLLSDAGTVDNLARAGVGAFQAYNRGRHIMNSVRNNYYNVTPGPRIEEVL